MNINQLIEDYERRINTLSEMIRNADEGSKHLLDRWGVKKGCYRTFVAELKQLEQNKL